MNRDNRIYRRSTLLQLSEDPTWPETIDSLEIANPVGPPDARFQLVTGNLQIPACSFVSRGIDDAWFIDTGVDYDGGRMYIGQNDFEGMASVAGYVAKSSVSRIYEENERLRHDLVLAQSVIGDLRRAVAGMVGAATVERDEDGTITQRTSKSEPEPLPAEDADEDMGFSLDG